MCSNPAESGAAVVRQQGRSWSLVARLAFFYTLGVAALLLVTMAILYGVVVQHIDADDNTFLIDKLRAARTDLADNRFYRADAARSSNPTGAGLGLAIVKSIMDLHGGSVSARSEPGEGTTVTLKFFREKPPAQSHHQDCRDFKSPV